MLKLIQKQIDTNLIRISLIFAFIYCALFNAAVFLYKFEYYKASMFKGFLELGKDFIYIYVALFILFFGLSVHRALFIAATGFLFITGALASYYLYFFKITPTVDMIGSFFGTDFNEVYEIVSIRLIVWLTFSLFVCIYSIKYFKIPENKLFVTRILSALCLFLTINAIISPPYKVLSSYFPMQYLHNAYEYFAKHSKNKHAREDISQKFTFKDGSAKDVVGVIVIGESARYDHFGVNGYERNTTPRLSSINNFFSFKAQSCSNLTYISVPCMLSRRSAGELDLVNNETGLLSVMSKVGFKTNWIGTQSLMKYFSGTNLGVIYDEVDFAIIPGGSVLFKMNDHDEVMFPFIEKMLADNEKQILVVHTSGSHWNYSSRYPPEFAQFTPGCAGFAKSDHTGCSQAELINIYDNSILYTDFFLYSLINLLKDKNAFLLYASDHAEGLGENGRYGHGGEITEEQTTIPFMIWVSDKFKNQNMDSVRAINSHLGKEISHDYIFHTVLDCIGIESDIVDKKYSLCKARND